MKKSLAALAALGAIAGSLSPTGAGFAQNSPVATASAASSKSQPVDAQRSTSSDTKAHRIGTGYVRHTRAPVGKRYRASVRQHQRHAAKARNVRRSKR